MNRRKLLAMLSILPFAGVVKAAFHRKTPLSASKDGFRSLVLQKSEFYVPEEFSDEFEVYRWNYTLEHNPKWPKSYRAKCLHCGIVSSVFAYEPNMPWHEQSGVVNFRRSHQCDKRVIVVLDDEQKREWFRNFRLI